MLYGDPSRRGRPFSKDPAVVRFGQHALLYYSLPPFGSGQTHNGGNSPGWPEHGGWAIGIARSYDLETWDKVGEIPTDAYYEANGFCAPGALVLHDRVHLFYQTYGNGPRDAICHAVSEDGITFVRNPTNPIFSPTGDWTCGRAIDADVVIDGDRVLLYFATRDPTMTIQMLGVAAAPLNSDFGRDTWTQLYDGPILRPELPWEQECIEAPAVCKRNNKFFMWYGGAYNNMPQQIGCAISDDSIHWQRLFTRPFLPNGGPGCWNACESGHPYVFIDDDGETYLFFQGNNDLGQTWYLSMRKIIWREERPLLEGKAS